MLFRTTGVVHWQVTESVSFYNQTPRAAEHPGFTGVASRPVPRCASRSGGPGRAQPPRPRRRKRLVPAARPQPPGRTFLVRCASFQSCRAFLGRSGDKGRKWRRVDGESPQSHPAAAAVAAAPTLPAGPPPAVNGPFPWRGWPSATGQAPQRAVPLGVGAQLRCRASGHASAPGRLVSRAGSERGGRRPAPPRPPISSGLAPPLARSSAAGRAGSERTAAAVKRREGRGLPGLARVPAAGAGGTEGNGRCRGPAALRGRCREPAAGCRGEVGAPLPPTLPSLPPSLPVSFCRPPFSRFALSSLRGRGAALQLSASGRCWLGLGAVPGPGAAGVLCAAGAAPASGGARGSGSGAGGSAARWARPRRLVCVWAGARRRRCLPREPHQRTAVSAAVEGAVWTRSHPSRPEKPLVLRSNPGSGGALCTWGWSLGAAGREQEALGKALGSPSARHV